MGLGRGRAGAIVVYALVLALMGAALIDVSASGVRSVTALIDHAIAESVDELRQASAGQHENTAGTQKERSLRGHSDDADSTAFPHARPAPRFVERRDAAEIDQLKQGVVERVVADDPTPWLAEDVRTYRTMCVRLCDGAYFPISFATTRKRFAEDETKCASRCGSPARLFAFPNDGGTPEVMKDRSGRSYIALPTAFQFRKGSDATCTCRAAPWEEASKERHRRYALEAAHDDERSLAVAEARTPASLTASGDTGTDTPRSEPEVQSTANAHPEAAPPIATAALGNVSKSTPTEQPGQPPAAIPAPKHEPNDLNRAAEPEPQGSAEDETSDPTSARVSATAARKASRQRKPAASPPVPVVAGAVVGAVPATAPGRIPPSITRLYADKPIWGVGRNAHSSPRGGSAAETFARNFY